MTAGQDRSLTDAEWIHLAGWDVLVLEETGSTNDDAKRLSTKIPGEFIVWAKNQSAGRGREDRQWQSAEGCSLTFSLVLRALENEKSVLNRFTALGALALTDLLDRDFAIKAEIKWPNDVLIAEKKVSGILTEMTWQGPSIETIIIGIGVNLRDGAYLSSSELRFPATSIEKERVKIDSPHDFLEKLLGLLQKRRQQLDSDQFLADWNQKLAFNNKFIPIKQYQGKTEMLCPGSINSDGSLNARDQAGNWRLIHSAELSVPSSNSLSSTEESSSS